MLSTSSVQPAAKKHPNSNWIKGVLMLMSIAAIAVVMFRGVTSTSGETVIAHRHQLETMDYEAVTSDVSLETFGPYVPPSDGAWGGNGNAVSPTIPPNSQYITSIKICGGDHFVTDIQTWYGYADSSTAPPSANVGHCHGGLDVVYNCPSPLYIKRVNYLVTACAPVNFNGCSHQTAYLTAYCSDGNEAPSVKSTNAQYLGHNIKTDPQRFYTVNYDFNGPLVAISGLDTVRKLVFDAFSGPLPPPPPPPQQAQEYVNAGPSSPRSSSPMLGSGESITSIKIKGGTTWSTTIQGWIGNADPLSSAPSFTLGNHFEQFFAIYQCASPKYINKLEVYMATGAGCTSGYCGNQLAKMNVFCNDGLAANVISGSSNFANGLVSQSVKSTIDFGIGNALSSISAVTGSFHGYPALWRLQFESTPLNVGPPLPLELYFDFSEISNDKTAIDCKGGRTVTYNHGVSLQGDGKATQNGDNIVAPISNTESIKFEKAKSYSVFLEYSIRDVSSDYWFFLFGKMGSSPYPRDMTLWTNPGRKELTFAITNNGYQCRGFFPSNYVAGEKYNVAFVYDGDTQLPQFYFNGAPATQTCGPVSVESVTSNLIYVGGDPSHAHARSFPGTFYRVMLFNDKLGATEIQEISGNSQAWQAILAHDAPNCAGAGPPPPISNGDSTW